jgi:hypothetical protein
VVISFNHLLESAQQNLVWAHSPCRQTADVTEN